jgi:hypothetical protein
MRRLASWSPKCIDQIDIESGTAQDLPNRVLIEQTIRHRMPSSSSERCDRNPSAFFAVRWYGPACKRLGLFFVLQMWNFHRDSPSSVALP